MRVHLFSVCDEKELLLALKILYPWWELKDNSNNEQVSGHIHVKKVEVMN